jgi:spore germination cell wall hydrolase CwlJ-like protein
MEKALRLTAFILGIILVSFLVMKVTDTKFNNLRERNGYYSQDVVTIKTRERQLDCLALNIYREAGHESFEGKVAVAQVTMNRAAHPDFPKDICGVIYQKSVIMEKVVCQFSWYCESGSKVAPLQNAAYKESYEVAKKVLLEGFKLDVLKEALYYHANYVNPKWNLDKIGSIGNHIFYKPKDKGTKK